MMVKSDERLSDAVWSILEHGVIALRDRGIDAMRAEHPAWSIDGWIRMFAAARNDFKRREGWGDADQ
jgi:hypothetical protein